ncbi:MAG: DUF4856 domain-containing protein [Colwellia sp.]|uniref:DUF4856 domain-containing protein n=1 Tax=Colwellia sp. TaxID=56799 RepID=UPI001D23B1A7|nr:DUF4856 domain-containing protein [Colwellia sp.]NQY49823.1 DUF4856 domain-containing protein [Colwellia sp.]
MKFQRKALAIAVMVATSTLSACSSDDVKEIINDKITKIELSSNSVDENSKGAEVGSISTDILDSIKSFTYSTDNENFVISGNTLSLAAEYSFDYEKEQTVDVNITATDSSGTAVTKALTIEVNDLLDYYGFMSKVGDTTQSSVSYGGQVTRHALIAELKHYIGKGGLQADIDGNNFADKDSVIAKLNSFYNRGGDIEADRDSSWDGFAITFAGENAKQTLFSELGSYKSLKDKVAGNDASGQHKEWNNGAFAGWGIKGSITPHGLIAHYFDQLADNAVAVIGGAVRVDPITGGAIPVYVSENGTDLNQLVQKFLLMSVTYSQATDDYLDENKGLATDNIDKDKGTKDYTKLEHQFDEGFGYFGATRDYLAYNDNEIAGKVKVAEDGRSDWNGQHDTDGDGKIDLMSEKNFGNSVNAAKRDRGTAANAKPTDYTKQAMEAFLNGRKLINDKAGFALTEAEMTELLGYRDAAVKAWENAVAGTVIHYINDLDADLAKLDSADFSFTDTAKHFSELKGFALGLQFNPYSPITDAQFEQMHTLLKDAPVLTGDVTAYRADLIKARDILQAALSFDADNVAGW